MGLGRSLGVRALETPLPSHTVESRLKRLIRRASLVLLWEDLWPPLALSGAVVLLFAAASWFGLWFQTPPLFRLFALAAFGLAIVAALFPLVRLRWADPSRALSRLDRDAPIGHRPASQLQDTLANPEDDAATRALWALHKQSLAAGLQRITVAQPSPNLPARDPYALRFAAVLLAVVGFLAAGSERLARLAAAFYSLPSATAATQARIDAWINPPPYTGKPPIFLKSLQGPENKTIIAPEDSVLVVRGDPAFVSTHVTGGIKPQDKKNTPDREFLLQGDGETKIYAGQELSMSLSIHVTPRTAPTIRLLELPQSNLSGSLTLHYEIHDPYGIRDVGGAVDAPNQLKDAPKHRLYDPPTLALPLPGSSGSGEMRTTVDLSEHPWAGAHVTLTLLAKSISEMEAKSSSVEMDLPQRRFANPLARALVELRRDLVLDPDGNTAKVREALDSLKLGPDLFETSPRVYIDLDGVGRLLTSARSDDELRETSTWLWKLALSIEDGSASQALKDLRNAENRLRDALKRNASPDELKKLTQELREAAERFLAENMRNQKEQNSQDQDASDSKDLDSLFDKLEKDADSGAKVDAEAMLDELQDMMENLQSAESSKSDPAQKQVQKTMKDLDKLLKDQQALRDETFRQDQRERSGRQPSDSDKGDAETLEQRQSNLRQRLEDMRRELQGKGAEPPPNLGEAQSDMSEAEKNLKDKDGADTGGRGKSQRRYGRSPKGDAVEAQGKAIEALRKGSEAMQQQMKGKGKGKGYAARPGSGLGEKGDPLGRRQDGHKGAAEGQLSGGPESAERARRVLEELRRRLSDPNRSSDEREYLERLIGRP